MPTKIIITLIIVSITGCAAVNEITDIVKKTGIGQTKYPSSYKGYLAKDMPHQKTNVEGRKEFPPEECERIHYRAGKNAKSKEQVTRDWEICIQWLNNIKAKNKAYSIRQKLLVQKRKDEFLHQEAQEKLEQINLTKSLPKGYKLNSALTLDTAISGLMRGEYYLADIQKTIFNVSSSYYKLYQATDDVLLFRHDIYPNEILPVVTSTKFFKSTPIEGWYIHQLAKYWEILGTANYYNALNVSKQAIVIKPYYF